MDHQTCQLQASERVLAPFNVALALSIAKIQRFEEQILDLLKSAIMTNFKDSDRYRMSKWIQGESYLECTVALSCPCGQFITCLYYLSVSIELVFGFLPLSLHGFAYT